MTTPLILDNATLSAPVRGRVARSWASVLRSPLGISAVIAITALLLVALVGSPLLSTAAGTKDLDARLAGPSATHLLGTDELGRDILARTVAASGISVGMALAATGIAFLLGIVLGIVPVVVGRRARRAIVAAIDALLAFPWLLTAMFFSLVWSGGLVGPLMAVSLAAVPSFARLSYTLASSVSDRDYVRAGRVLGVSRRAIIVRHILPNIAEPLIVNAASAAGGMLLAFSVLSFLGIGIQPPYADWGRLFNEGMARFYTAPLASITPGVAIVLASLAFSLLGEALAAATGIRPEALKSARSRRLRRGTFPVAPVAAGEPVARVLSIENLTISFDEGRATRTVVDGIDLEVMAGEIVGIVGESGSGKSLTALAASGLIDPSARVSADRLEVVGIPVPAPGAALDKETRARLGTQLAMVFQDPMSSLNPSLRVGTQLAEPAVEHLGLSRRTARIRVVDRLRDVHISEPERRAAQFPQGLSGGMRQRASIAMGLMGTPLLIIADEPTTALDVTVQKKVVGLLQEARDRDGAAVLMISHDIALVSSVCDRIVVMYQGRIVERLRADELADARHPYTRALVACVPDMHADRDAPLPTITEMMPRVPVGSDGVRDAADVTGATR